jgi:pyruvate/2-oxoacid:ferredoxin oxidoreductase alpha subunit
MRHEEAGAFAAAAEASLTGRLTACAGSCGPGSLHFINGLYEANRNRAPTAVAEHAPHGPLFGGSCMSRDITTSIAREEPRCLPS